MRELRLRVVKASRDDAPLLDNLLALYAYDFSEMLALEISADGSYVPDGWSWSAEDHVWLLYVDDRPAGFAVATRGSLIDGRPDVWDMREFFILRRHRRAGAGLHLARAVWEQLPGVWDVRVIEPNVAALGFWRRAVADAAGRAVAPTLAVNTRNGKSERVFRFEPSSPSRPDG